MLMSLKLAKFGLTATEADVMRLGKHVGADDNLDNISTEAVSGDKSTEGCVYSSKGAQTKTVGWPRLQRKRVGRFTELTKQWM